jgi:SAM-dependent methyltransferase
MINELPTNDNSKIVNFFYNRIDSITNYLITFYNLEKSNILDVGGGSSYYFPFATDIFDINTSDYIKESIKNEKNEIKTHNVDIDFDKFPFYDNFFNFVYCRHTLEDIQNPQNAFNEIIRVSKRGYIETPSPICEIIKGIDGFGKSICRGYLHHRYFVWSDIETNTLFFLPKYNIIETITYDDNKMKDLVLKLNNDKFLWNNYYIFDENNKPKIFVYRNGVNFKISDVNSYTNLINTAITKSINYTNIFIKNL